MGHLNVEQPSSYDIMFTWSIYLISSKSPTPVEVAVWPLNQPKAQEGLPKVLHI